MIETKKAPKIRFAGFTDAWEQRKLGDITSYIKGFAFKSVDYKADGIRIIRVSDLSKDCVSEDVDKIYIDKNKAKQYINYTINDGDIVITTVGSKAELKESAVGRPIIFTENKGYLLNQNLVKITPIPNYDSEFIYNQLLSERYTKYIVDIQRGNANQANITISDLWEYSFHCTAFLEQKKIGQFFNKLDSIITLHQRKYNKLEVMKKSMLEKMFPKSGSNIPEIRFAGFTDAWEQRKFSDITYLAGEKNRNNIPYQSYSISNEKGFIPQDEQFENGGTMKEADKSMYLIVQPNSFAYNPARINVGSIGYYDLPENVIVSSLYEVFKTSDDIDDRFLWHWFKSDLFPKFIERYQEGGVRMYFYYNKLCMCSLDLPSIEEQRKIGKYFDKFDNLITLHQRKLEKLKKIKKSMLEKMFV